jgi:hypothetical protein
VSAIRIFGIGILATAAVALLSLALARVWGPDASPPEIAWTLVGLPGVWTCIRNARRARGDMGDADAEKMGGAVRLDLLRRVVTHRTLAFVQGVFVAAGVASMLAPPANPSVPVPRGLVFVSAGLLLGEMALTWLSIYQDRSRDAVLRLARVERTAQQFEELRAHQVIADSVRAREVVVDGGALDDVAARAARRALEEAERAD